MGYAKQNIKDIKDIKTLFSYVAFRIMKAVSFSFSLNSRAWWTSCIPSPFIPGIPG